MSEMPLDSCENDGPARKPGSAGDDPTTAGPAVSRSGGPKTPTLVAGLAALLLAGPIAAGSVAAEDNDSHPSFHDQFARAFMPGAMSPGECGSCTVKLPE